MQSAVGERGDGGVREKLAARVGMPRLRFMIRAMLRRGMS
jgi:hypothetical protein